jgi:hypothetical protein
LYICKVPLENSPAKKKFPSKLYLLVNQKKARLRRHWLGDNSSLTVGSSAMQLVNSKFKIVKNNKLKLFFVEDA